MADLGQDSPEANAEGRDAGDILSRFADPFPPAGALVRC